MFLTERLWLEDSTNQLCRELHEGAAFASFALGESADVELYARAIIEQVPLEDSIAAHAYYIRSLNKAGRFTEALATGLVLLRRLSIDIPFAPSPTTMMDEMTKSDIENWAHLIKDLEKDTAVRALMVTKKKADA